MKNYLWIVLNESQNGIIIIIIINYNGINLYF